MMLKARGGPIAITRARAILMAMAGGFMFRVMATSGSLISRLLGHRTRQEDGSGSRTTAGPGFLTNHGAGRRITMAGGFITAATGAGGLDQSMWAIVRCGLQRLSSLSALDTTQALGLDPSAGFRWGRMMLSIPGTDAASTA